MSKIKPKKEPKANLAEHGKIPKTTLDPASEDHKTVVWQIGRIDHDGKWGWQGLCKNRLWNDIIPKLKDFETMTWHEIHAATKKNKGNLHHFIPKTSLNKAAQERLRELNQDDIDKLFSLRLQGAHRIFGIKDGRVLKILWFDPDHEVCPCSKK
jgi:hypothetical protein